jgi:hypothetical protein
MAHELADTQLALGRACRKFARLMTGHLLFLSCTGFDPRIHLLAKMMDCRVKPGNDRSR